jgi:signal transduction histidine kinase/CheY-like chemotaxis protein
MLAPLPSARYRAVAMRLGSSLDKTEIIVTNADGSTLSIECETEALAGLQQELTQTTKELAIPRDASAAKERVSDVTERIKAQRENVEAQRENVESRRIFEDLLDNSDAAIIDYDFSILFRVVQQLKHGGVVNLRNYIAEEDERLEKLVDVVRINYANATALRMLGVSSLQELGKQSKNIVDIAEAIFEGTTRIRGSEYLVAGGTPIPVVYSLRIPGTDEEARRVPIVIMDLSDIKLAEAARQATVAKSQFLSSMSHEIRTPLNGVIGNLELLALTSLDNEQFELIDDADKAAKALLGLVGNILDFSKIEAGKLTTEMGDINPAALVEEAVAVVQSLGRQKKIFVASTFGADVPSLVRGDAMRIRQILLNLIGNAVKFTELGGVEVTLAVTAWDQEVCELRFEVHDSGRGFDQIVAGKLFEPFTQDRKAADGTEGTGLGLSICKSLVEAFGGTIGCEGIPGEGATFWFVLPVAVVRRAPPVAQPDLTRIKAMVIGGGDAAKSLAGYFTARGASVTTEALAPLAFPTGSDAEMLPMVDVAVIIPDDSGTDISETTRLLQEQYIVPLIYDGQQPPRIRLRQGFAATIPSGASADFLDRNIRLLIGHAQARDRLAAQQAAVVSAFGPGLRGKRLLVLEDRLVNQTVIEKQLKKLGIDCLMAANGLKGLEVLEDQQVDLILCDCSMPEMNGYDFTRALRRDEAAAGKGARVPVIALTANAFREDAEKCFEAGMDDFMSKPVTMDRLAAMLVKWLSPSQLAQRVVPPPREEPSVVPPMIDMERLAEILGANEPETLNEVLEEFLTAARSSLMQVQQAVENGNADTIAAAVHGAKGESASAAASALTTIYIDLEAAAKGGDTLLSHALVVQADAEVRRIETFLQIKSGKPPLAAA